MKILIANPGSTSYKCKLFDMSDEQVLFEAAVERIGDATGIYSYQFQNEDKKRRELRIPDFHSAVNLTLETLGAELSGADLSAVGFKTVHAKGVTGCVALTEDVLQAMRDYLPLAPVHNQVYLTAISVFRDILVGTPLYGLFETSFHAEIPPEAYLYGIPYEYYEKYGIRKYGFHGASHRYIGQRACELFVKEGQDCKVISCHLGGSSSVCAIKNGISLDTSMGMSPQSGLLNATRTGDLDTYALLYLMEKEGLSIEETRKMLMSRGGVYGISGSSGDMRDIESAMEKGSGRDELAFRTFAYYVKRYIGEYLAVLNGADVIAFTGGAGQNSVRLRKTILKDMEALGIHIDDAKNDSNPKEGLISKDVSPVKIAVIPTNEELIVAREVEKSLNE
jgi:acetate kinase